MRGKVPLHYGYEAFGVQEVVTYSSEVTWNGWVFLLGGSDGEPVFGL